MEQLRGDWFVLPFLTLIVPAVVLVVTVSVYLRRLRSSGRGVERADLAMYGAVAAVTLGAVLVVVVPRFVSQVDEERDLLIARLCARLQLCPMVGNEMNRLRVPLGPLNRMLMTAMLGARLGLPHILAAILIQHVAAALLAAHIARTYFGRRAGLAAGVLLGVSGTALSICVSAGNGAWVSFFIVATLWGVLRWVEGDGAIAFVAAATAYLCAIQLHGTALAMAPAIALVAVVARPRTPRYAIELVVAIAVAMYASWLRHAFETNLAWAHASTVGWAFASPSGAHRGRLSSLVAFLVRPGGVVTLATVACVLLFLRGRRAPPADPSRRTTEAILILFAVPAVLTCVGAVLAGPEWADRYNVQLVPSASILGGALLAELVSRGPVFRGVAALGALHHLSSANIGDAGFAWRPGLTETTTINRALANHGFAIGDLETRVHGRAFSRWDAAFVALGLDTMPRVVRGSSPEHALLAECAISDRTFATFVEPVARERFLVGYLPSLGFANVSIEGAERRDLGISVPLFSQLAHGGDQELRRAVDPSIAVAPAWAAVNTLWNTARPRALHVRGSTLHASPPRTLTVIGPVNARLRVESPQGALPVFEQISGPEVVSRVHLPAREPDSAVDITIELGDGELPRRFDVFEEPESPCLFAR